MIFLSSSIHVSATVDQQLDEIENRVAIDALVDSVIQIHVAQVDDGPYRCTAPEIPSIGVCAVIEEKSGDIEMVIEDRHEQRCDLIRIRQLDIRACTDQQTRFLQPAVASGIQE